MNFNILDFLWYLIKLLSFAALSLFLIAICVAIINVMIDSFKKRKMQNSLEIAIKKAIEQGECAVINKEQEKEIDKIIKKK